MQHLDNAIAPVFPTAPAYFGDAETSAEIAAELLSRLTDADLLEIIEEELGSRDLSL